MKINIAASHRFHLLDLARELARQGHDVCFYSYLPVKRTRKFGLNSNQFRSLFLLNLPLLFLIRIFGRASWLVKLLYIMLDFYVSIFMKPCDVFIALGTVYERSFISAKRKYNAVTIIEWGSAHIIEQENLLSKIPKFKIQDEFFISRSLRGYINADYISIPSTHVSESFIKHGFDKRKILKNHYGVDLEVFKPTKLKRDSNYDLILVGGWSYRKGCDLLAEVCSKENFKLLHVGPIVDLDFPNNKNFTHIDSVEQNSLLDYYEKAKVFILPSREDGFGMVLSQALACGLPIVCSKNTGGSDLRELLIDKKWIVEISDYTIEGITLSIKEALKLAAQQKGLREYGKCALGSLTWKSYGERYSSNINILKKLVYKLE